MHPLEKFRWVHFYAGRGKDYSAAGAMPAI